MLINLFFLFLAIIFNTFASTFFKYSSLMKNKMLLSITFLLLGLLLGAINAIFYTKSLKYINLNVAYPVFSAGSIILIIIVSLFLFHEVLSFWKIIGILIICIGIFVVVR